MLLAANWSVLVASWNFDVLYIPGSYWAKHSVLASIVARIRGKRVVYHFHNLFLKHYGFLDWLPYLVTDFVHNTKLGYEWTIGLNPKLSSKKHVVLPCVIDMRENVPADPSALQEFVGRRNIVFIGQVSPHKGIDLLVRAFQQIAARHPDAALHIIGSTLPDYETEFRQLIGGPFGDRIRFWGYRSDALHLLRRAYVYVHPSPPSRFQESFGRGVVEAMSLGVPAVCFASGAFSEIVQNGRSGWVCEEESVDSLASVLDAVLSDPALRDRVASGALTQYKEKYSPEVVVPQWREFFRALSDRDCASVSPAVSKADA
jgi:glycosyltransferase involved in cell wall biosynthesis